MSRSTARKIANSGGPRVSSTTQSRQQRPAINPDFSGSGPVPSRNGPLGADSFPGARAAGRMTRKPAAPNMYVPSVLLDPSQVEDRTNRIRRPVRPRKDRRLA